MSQSVSKLAPLPLWKALLLFIPTSASIYFGIYFVIPILLARGLTFLSSYLICFYPTFIALFCIALVLYWREGNALSWDAFQRRYRLRPIKGKTWIWAAGLLVFGVAATLALSFTTKWLASIPFLAPPYFMPSEFNPLKTAIPDTFMGTSVHGQWGYALAYFVGWLFNILGEELLWRGYMLPRQEVSYGKWAWLVHGLLWTAWHFFWKWQLLALLPVTLGIAFVVQRTRNTTVAILTHGLVNFLPLVGLVAYIIV
jgi:membrane protease YdiL (CAAX protease family)